jgi:hypothetical protein
MQKFIPNLIIAGTVVASILIITIAALVQFSQYIQLQQNKTRYQAIDECLKASSMTTTHKSDEREAQTNEPIRDVYNFCLQDKGITQK